VSTWRALFHRMFHGLAPAAAIPRSQVRDFDGAIKAKYGGSVAKSCVGDTPPLVVPQDS
jgi:hypothetical protein